MSSDYYESPGYLLFAKTVEALLLGAGFILEELDDMRKSDKQFSEWTRQQAEFDKAVGHPEWTPKEWIR